MFFLRQISSKLIIKDRFFFVFTTSTIHCQVFTPISVPVSTDSSATEAGTASHKWTAENSAANVMPSEECQQVLRTLHEGLAGELVDFTVPQNVGKMKNSRGMDGGCLINNTSCGCLMICNRYVRW